MTSIWKPERFPFMWTDVCPDCDTRLVAVVDQTATTPDTDGARMRVPFVIGIVWMQSCDHIDTMGSQLE